MKLVTPAKNIVVYDFGCQNSRLHLIFTLQFVDEAKADLHGKISKDTDFRPRSDG